ncbi:type VI secretion system tube protein TssD [Chitinophaga vietnamensis]|uniref:type VI secretion system tube protein TssD n=1 Tax=Chitinophaga vietnamensis TaxID=2593957 RepID=UPI0011782ED3|nr:type VI secretion system tube protein TssD [Chitinophaga vietnamensis]
MSFKAVFNIDGEEMNVLECQFSFTQSTDLIGKPSARPTGGTVELLVESTGETGLFDWMISNTQTKSGNVIFYRRDSMSKLKELRFTDAYCIAYTEQFNAANEQPMQIRMKLSAREIKLNNSVYQHPWPM